MPVAVLQLQRQAFPKIAGENAGRIEGLQAQQGRLYPRGVAAQLFGDGLQIRGDIARIVERADEMQADQPVHGVGQVHA